MALGTRARTGRAVHGLVHHSDAGSQYTAIRYATRLLDAGALASIGSVGDSFVYRPSRQPATGPPGSYPDRTSTPASTTGPDVWTRFFDLRRCQPGVPGDQAFLLDLAL